MGGEAKVKRLKAKVPARATQSTTNHKPQTHTPRFKPENRKLRTIFLIFVPVKKLLVIILLSALCFNSLGYFVMHSYLKAGIRSAVKMQIKEGVPDSELVNIIYSESNAAEFQWKHEREFCYRGKMYDIVTRENLSDGNVLFQCVSDEQETALFKNLNRIVNNSLNGNAKNTQAFHLLTTFLTGLYFTELLNFVPDLQCTGVNFGTEIISYHTPSLLLLSPPPKRLI